MRAEDEEDTTTYTVVVNHEEQYSIWPEDRDIPLGWNAVGQTGPKKQCLDYIEEVWTDMRPLSLRKQMEEMEARRPELEAEEARRREEEKNQPKDPRDDLVKFLSVGDHPVEIGLRPERSLELFRKALDRAYVHLKFTDTRGGTELGVRVDQEATNLSEADFESESGMAHIVGELTLNYVKVRCIADIDVATFSGYGRLEPLDT